MSDPATEYLTPAEVATVLNVHKWTVYREIKAGRIAAIRVGRALRIHRATLVPAKPEGAVA